MYKIAQKPISISLMVIAVVAISAFFLVPLFVQGAPAKRDANRLPLTQGATCDTAVSTSAIIGNEASVQLLATSSTRLWAKIQVANGASTTNWLSFAADSLAVVDTGVALNATTTVGRSTIGNEATTTIEFHVGGSFITEQVFGINTDFPYTGAVQGITNYGSTTVTVTECSA